MIEKIGHYSLTSPASVYDEEALTALELAGRTAAKVNEAVGAFNTLEEETEDHLQAQDKEISERLKAQDNAITKMNDVTMPEKVTSEVQERIDDGSFDHSINKYIGNLEERVDNLVSSVPAGGTTADAELVDIRVSADGVTYGSAGESVRSQFESVTTDIKNLGVNRRNLFDKRDITEGYYVTAGNGVLQPNSEFFASNFIYVGDLETVDLDWTHITVYYDKNKAYLGCAPDAAFLGILTDTLPEGTYYVRFSAYLTDLDKVQIGANLTRANYTPFVNYELPDLTLTEKQQTGISESTFNKLGFTHINRFDKTNITEGYYVVAENGNLAVNEYFFASDFIYVGDLDSVSFLYTHIACYYNADRVYLGCIPVNTTFENYTLPITDDIKYVRFSAYLTDVDRCQIGDGIDRYSYVGYETVKNDNLKVDVKQINGMSFDNTMDFAISIPERIYLRSGEEFSIWYRNIIHGYQQFKNGAYSIRCQKVTNGVYEVFGSNCTVDKFNFIVNGESEFDLEFRLMETYTNKTVCTKTTHVIVKDSSGSANKTPSICILGDSFTDHYGISSNIFTMLKDEGFTPSSVGLNDAGNGYTDAAWSGYGIYWYSTYETGYLRADRPLSDAVWDSGWGKNEANGWTEGQTYNDLTEDQRSHGHTKNEFFNPSTRKFDFSYYMTTYHPDLSGVDIVVLNIGLNDILWPAYSKDSHEATLYYLKEMIASIHSYSVDTKIIVCLVPPQAEGDGFLSNHSTLFITSELGKSRIERWNQLVLDGIDTEAYRNQNVFIAPVNAHIDAENGYRSTIIQTNKFDSSITEEVTNDIHPNENGSKYIADCITHTIIGIS